MAYMNRVKDIVLVMLLIAFIVLLIYGYMHGFSSKLLGDSIPCYKLLKMVGASLVIVGWNH